MRVSLWFPFHHPCSHSPVTITDQCLRVCFPSTLQFFITHMDHIFTFQKSDENSAQQLVDVKGNILKVYKIVHGDDHIKSDDKIDAIEIGGHGVSLFL